MQDLDQTEVQTASRVLATLLERIAELKAGASDPASSEVLT